ncbi:hypothetical protein DPX39_040009500 [Trypanosoma brucei equiperdum]|uniref:Uncharacterized protein n=1 Tax=Trypanosoma brucei equiperdum TaxID=630700 RepID=A0A3L6L820_9TRYP|nr:hypothetical protein DPX39_040009500 [Trypanosoma brucei equiperdum]
MTIFYEYPRALGEGTELFDFNRVPVTPLQRPLFSEVLLSALNLNNVSTTNRDHERENGRWLLPSPPRRVLLLGNVKDMSMQLITSILAKGCDVRVLQSSYSDEALLLRLRKECEEYPGHLLLFHSDELSHAVLDCDAVVDVKGSETPTGRLSLLRSAQSLFEAIRASQRAAPRVILMAPVPPEYIRRAETWLFLTRIESTREAGTEEEAELLRANDMPYAIMHYINTTEVPTGRGGTSSPSLSSNSILNMRSVAKECVERLFSCGGSGGFPPFG